MLVVLIRGPDIGVELMLCGADVYCVVLILYDADVGVVIILCVADGVRLMLVCS